MAQHRPKVPTRVKAELLSEAGERCSNAGCANTTLEIHHIREWAIYRTHDPEHMIALCPACHDAVTRGSLRLSDDMLYEWKTASPDRWASINVPPAALQRLLLGSVTVTSTHPFAVFDFGSGQSLSFHLDDTGTVLTLNADICDLSGRRLLTMRQSTASFIADNVHIEQRPGRVKASLDGWQTLLPLWAYRQLWNSHQDDVVHGLPLFDIEVVRQGVVRVSGIWSSRRTSIVITASALVFLTQPASPRPVSIVGEGESTTLRLQGDGATVLFGVERATDASEAPRQG